MLKNLKLFSVILLLLGASLVMASSDPKYIITDVEVNDVSTFGPMYVERGETLEIDVFMQGNMNDNESIDNVRIEAELGGYDRDKVREETDSFIIQGSLVYSEKELNLELPDDLEPGIDYILRVRAYDRINEFEYDDIILRVEEKEHLLTIEDVVFDPNLHQVNPGDRLYANVRVKNFGSTTEEDIKVSMSIPTLGLSTSDYINELDTEVACDNDDDDCEDADTKQVNLLIPEDASGEHDVMIKVEYDDGDEVLEKRYTLTLGEAAEDGRETVIDVSPGVQEIALGEGAAYKITLTNIADEKQTYTVSAAGLESWATFDIEPSIVTVNSEETEEVLIFVTAREDANTGTNFFTVKVEVDSTTEEITLEARLIEDGSVVSAWDSVKTGLEIGFIILLIILVILGIVLAVRRTRGSEEFEEPRTEEGKSYY